MTQKEWLYKLSEIPYLTDKQLEVLKKNKYIERYKYKYETLNSYKYIFYLNREGAEEFRGDLYFYVDVIKDDCRCFCGGYYEFDEEYYEKYKEKYDKNYKLLRCSKCKDEKLKKYDN